MPHVDVSASKRRRLGAVACLLVCSAVIASTIAGTVAARSSDRTKPMDIDAGRQEGTLDGNSVNVLSGGVVITQGTLDIRAERADIHQRGNQIVRAVLTGRQATLKQDMDDGTPMTARADRIDYDLTTEVIVLTGNYTVTTPRGSTSGQRLTYNLKTGRVDSGGEGNGRVKLRIIPNAAQGAPAPTPPAKPAGGGQGGA